ncbi:hypothetical protein [Reichenbachiella ulvae]|uniref:Bacteriophage lambda head decoration protein D n=1 Tax=Reichenbachiella ulvae TaxID=2980104 RepID=A0ABT3CQ57_9BACT|nr:hypothetical protein [Reichenbachiella ulvae]MCV9385855.1 hypothetical protein [Reichenbachiella ulvae]
MSKTSYVDIEDQVQLPDHGVIRAKLTIGNGQTGGHSVFLGNNLLGQDSEVEIGEAAGLKGKQLIATCTVVDTNADTNWTSFTLLLKQGGDDLKTFGPYSKKVDKDKDVVGYTLIIDLI